MKDTCPSVIGRVCVIGNNRPHNMLFIQLADDVIYYQINIFFIITNYIQVQLSLQAEETVWEHVAAANSSLPPHSKVYRHHIILITGETPLPVSGKGDVLVRQVEATFKDQVDKMFPYLFILDRIYFDQFRYKNSALLSSKYPTGYLETLNDVDSYKQKELMVGLVKDVLASVLGFVDSKQIDLESTFEVTT